MLVQTQAPADKIQLQQFLQQAIPTAKVETEGPAVMVGRGAATGVLVQPKGQGQVKLVWGFPNKIVMFLLIVSIPLTGLLPGLLLFGLVWLVTKGGVDRLKQEVAAALQVQGGVQPYEQAGYGQAVHGAQHGQYAQGGGSPQPGQLPPGPAPPGQLPPGGGWGGQQ